MSVFPVDTVSAIADSVGVSLADAPVAEALLADAEYRMREVVFDARKFMRHARRSKLLPEDFNAALAVRNVQPIYGYSSTDTPAVFKSTIHANTRIYYLDDQEIDLDQIINAPLPPVPLDVAFTAHWLAIEGVQPAIVQNPTAAGTKFDCLCGSSHEHADIKNAAAEAAQNLSKSIASLATDGNSSTQIQPVAVSSSNPDQATVNGEVLVKNVLSKELQLYHDKIVESVLDADAKVSALAIDSLEKDPGIQPLLPYFVQFMTQRITKHVRSLDSNWAMMRMTRALLNNKNLFIEPYLHQLIPNILTCVVSKRLSSNPLSDHHALRRFASQVAAHVCQAYTATYPTLQPRVTRTLLRAFLDPEKSCATYYGAIAGLAGLGAEAVRMLVRPNVKAFVKDCLPPASPALSDRVQGSVDGANPPLSNDAAQAEEKDRDMVIEILVDVLHKNTVDDYLGQERTLSQGIARIAAPPVLSDLESKLTNELGQECGTKVARLAFASLVADSGRGGGSASGKRALNTNAMDLDI
ncbi:hypothetical protein HDU83_001937 [Entophlyctis luteolus]|nr:hypothetical protein HDU83_001937 [Entophlyctis luteolus]KAJ3387286.1 hypothetical protein HDU84_000936 [Entophlyctis sp. JEL0112]